MDEQQLNNHSNTDPVGISANGSILRPTAPTGTAFNRRTVMIIGLACSTIIMFGIMYAFTPQTNSKATETVMGENLSGQSQSGPVYTQTPDELNNLPSSYKANRQGAAPSPEELKYPAPEALMGEVPMISQFQSEYQPTGANANISTVSPFHRTDEITPEQKELAEARKSPIRFGSIAKVSDTTEKQQSEGEQLQAVLNAAMSNYGDSGQPVKSDQEKKEDFIKQNHSSAFYSKSTLQAPVSKYEVKAGTIIPAVMITGISSDLPGQIVAQVRENVYDTVTGHYLLIPQGSRIIGTYDSKVSYGQSRVLVVWSRLIYPNGYSLDLESLAGVDSQGYSGFKDKVNNHYKKLAGGILLTSIFSASVALAEDDDDSYEKKAASGAAENVANVGAKLAEKNLSIQPTIEIRPGYRFNVFVNKDFILQPFGRHK